MRRNAPAISDQAPGARRRRLTAGLAATLLLATVAAATNPPECVVGVPGDPNSAPWGMVYLPMPDPCEPAPGGTYLSKCWRNHHTSQGFTGWWDFANHPWYEQPGFPLNLSLRIGPAAGDYPPIGTTPETSSSPLLPGGARSRGPTTFAERPMAHGVADLITGAPLIQEVDLELPFGGAVFRHVRTAMIPEQGNLGHSAYRHGDISAEYFWDWNGFGWMMSENPIFLIDATYAEIVGSGPPRCWFIPDAHHSIPFDRAIVNGRAEYIAPPRFDATLTHDGVWNNVLEAWDTPPQTYVVYLHGGDVRYTIEAQVTLGDGPGPNDTYRYADVDDHLRIGGDLRSLHDRPDPVSPADYELGGHGMPGYGLVKRIEDRHGNRIEIEHCRQWQAGHEPENAPFTGAGGTYGPRGEAVDYTGTPGCRECLQNCSEKGQVRTVRLFAAGDPAPTWTLVYVHRSFWSLGGGADPGQAFWDQYPEYETYLDEPHGYRWLQSTALHSILVYPGEPAGLPSIEAAPCFTMDGRHFLFKEAPGGGTQGMATLDEADAVSTTAAMGLPDSWLHEMRYLYREQGDYLFGRIRTVVENPPILGLARADLDGTAPTGGAPMLLKATRISRSTAAAGSHADRRSTLYRYHRPHTSPWPKLKCILGPEAVANILAAEWPSYYEPVGRPKAVNDLFEIPTGDRVLSVPNPETGSPGLYAIEDLADLSLHYRWGSGATPVEGIHCTTFCETLLRDFHGDLAPAQVEDQNGTSGLSGFSVRSTSSPEQRHFNIYRFMRLPAPVDIGTCFAAAGNWQSRSIYHHPYTYRDPRNFDAPSPTDWNDPLWITVVDEWGSRDEVLSPPSFSGGVPLTRRSVRMNSAGYVLVDRTWEFHEGQGQLVASVGEVDEVVYEAVPYGAGQTDYRVIERRTAAWGVPTNTDPDDEGLVYAYTYGPNNLDGRPSRDIETVSVKRGTQGVPTKVAEFIRDDVFRDVVKFKREFDDSGAVVNETATTLTTELIPDFDPGGQLDPQDPRRFRITSRRLAHRPVPRDEGGTPFWSVTTAHYDDRGRTVWTGYGSLQDPAQVQPGDEFFLDYTSYDDLGRPRFTVVDATPDDIILQCPPFHPQLTLEIEPFPTGWSREAAPSKPPLRHATYYEYDGGGASLIIHPNGRMHLMRHRQLFGQTDGADYESRMFKDAVWDPEAGSQGALIAMSAGQVSRYQGGTLLSSRTVRWPAEFSPYGLEQLPYTALASLTPSRGGRGTVNGVTATPEPDAGSGTGPGGTATPPPPVSVQFDDFGEFKREIASNGTITRRIHDYRGRITHVYRGTADGHPFWHVQAANTQDNMVLTEKREYGAGVHDLGEIVAIRRMRQRPANQYGENGSPSDEDSYGWVERIEYDWRQRPVWIVLHGRNGAAINHTVTFFDNADRAAFVAVYGAIAPFLGADDPRHRTSGLPSAVTLLASGPLSLTQTVFNDRGLVAEIREYDAKSNDPDDYLATRTYYDHDGRKTLVITPNEGRTYFEHDPAGRLTVSRAVASGVEVARVETAYDADGNAISIVTRERPHAGASPGPLTDSNSITTVRYNWYDAANRVIATVDLGTGDPLDRFVATDDQNRPARPAQPPEWEDSTGGYNLPAIGLPADARVELYTYDSSGRRTRVRHVGGEVTDTVYDGLGRVVLTTQRTTGAGGETLSQTGYQYDEHGHLVRRAAVLRGHQLVGGQVNWAANDGTLQITRFKYGAAVLDEATLDPISLDHGLLAAIEFPDADTGLPDDAGLQFAYFHDGRLATRIDARGVLFEHGYDERGLRVQSTAKEPSMIAPLVPVPKDQSSHVKLAYDPLGRLSSATAITTSDAQGSLVVAQSRFEFDGVGNVVREWQAHGGEVQTAPGTGQTPSVQYDWALGRAVDGGNFNRLSMMTYPRWADSAFARQLTLQYAAGADTALSRVTGISDAALGQLAEFEYSGARRRVESRYGVNGGSAHALRQAFASDPITFPSDLGYDRLDRFGRPRELVFTRSDGLASSDVHSYRYGYDAAGNRAYARITQRDPAGGGGAQDNVRSFVYRYDAASRLVGADMGELDLSDPAQPEIVEPTQPPYPRRSHWAIDRLGNWNGDPLPAGGGAPPPPPVFGHRVTGDRDGDGLADPTLDVLHTTNALNEVSLRSVSTGGATPVATPLVYDASGNLASDGTYFYQYDAWNRLVQVNLLGTLTFDADGKPTGGAPGGWVLHYTYDGLGRLIRKQTPWTAARTEVRTESYYYDGVRRIQEVWRDPIPGEGPKSVSGGEPEGGGSYVVRTEREYVYAPGYVDEFICQIGATGAPVFMVQDASFNVVGLVDPSGAILAQYSWDPYGEVLAADVPDTSHPDNRVGHQGLFFDRLDAFAGDSGRTLTRGGAGVFQNRNRTYAPALGRFLQRDPVGSGVALVFGAADGETASRDGDELGHEMYGDGSNLYCYVRSRPVGNVDPMGLTYELDPSNAPPMNPNPGRPFNNLRPGQLIGPGWDVGGVQIYSPEKLDRMKRDMRDRADGLGDLAQAIVKAVSEGAGAMAAHSLYGQSGRAGQEVLRATLIQIGREFTDDVKDLLTGDQLPYGISDFIQAGLSIQHGDVEGAFESGVAGVEGFVGEFITTPVMLFALPALIPAYMYQGTLNYVVNDTNNWGFGVSGDALIDFYD